MKKILGISLVAVLAATPLMTRADTVSEKTATGNALTTQSYVIGAYNDLAGHINTKQDQLTAGESNISTSVVQAAAMDGKTVNTASDTALMSEKAVLTAIGSADSAMGTRVTALEGNTSFTSEEVAGNAYLTSQTDIAGNVVNVAEAVETLAGSGAGSVAAAVAAEETRATTAEGALGDRLDVLEGNGAGSVAAAVAAEETRATTAEGALSDRLDTLEAHDNALAGTYATKTGVDNTIKAVTLNVTQEQGISTTNGSITVATDWSGQTDPSTVSFLTAASLTGSTAVEINDNSVSYATANQSSGSGE